MLIRRALPRIPHFYRPLTSPCCIRPFSTTELSNGVKVAYDLHEPPAKTSEGHKEDAPAILFVHGLFGSKKNNRGMIFARDLKRPVYALDMRNHGDSSHDATHNYSALAEDIELFIKQHKLAKPTLIGHSMGAKTIMTVALRDRVPIANLIPVDSAPVDAALHSDFKKYVQGMREIADAKCKKQSDADSILQKYEESLTIRQFLLGCFERSEDGTYVPKVPIKILTNALDHMAAFPFTDPDETRFEGPMLMVRGTKSHYVADEMLPVVGRFFPKFELVDVDAGHWVISEKPEEFRQAVVEFLQVKD